MDVALNKKDFYEHSYTTNSQWMPHSDDYFVDQSTKTFKAIYSKSRSTLSYKDLPNVTLIILTFRLQTWVSACDSLFELYTSRKSEC